MNEKYNGVIAGSHIIEEPKYYESVHGKRKKADTEPKYVDYPMFNANDPAVVRYYNKEWERQLLRHLKHK